MVFRNGANSQQIEHLRRRLGMWRGQLVTKPGRRTYLLDKGNYLDLARQAANHNTSSLTPQDRRQKLIRKIGETLQQIEKGLYKL
jgi:RNA polymerase-binding transcription factor DksA